MSEKYLCEKKKRKKKKRNYPSIARSEDRDESFDEAVLIGVLIER